MGGMRRGWLGLALLIGLAACGDEPTRTPHAPAYHSISPPVPEPMSRMAVLDTRDPQKAPRLVMNLEADGRVNVKGMEFRLDAASPEERKEVRTALMGSLQRMHERARGGRLLVGPGYTGLCLQVAPASPWKHVRACIRAARLGRLPLEILQFGVGREGNALRHVLDLRVLAVEPSRSVLPVVDLERTANGATEIRMRERRWVVSGTDEENGPAGWQEVEAFVCEGVEAPQVTLRIGDDVTWAEVVRMLDLLYVCAPRSRVALPSLELALALREPVAAPAGK